MENINAINLLIFILTVYKSSFSDAWHSNSKPQIFGTKIPLNSILPSNKKVQYRIVKYHNFFRSNVEPSASDMLTMSWHEGAAAAAQKWASRCLHLDHDTASGRWIKDFGSCGQNIFLSTHHVPWFFAIKMWFMEKHNFTYGSSYNSLLAVGHYTQLVWSATHKVGCGFAQCKKPYIGKPYFSYICNYCPIGNHEYKLGRPYKRGEPCSSCEKHCRIKKLCTNSCPAADLWVNCGELYRTWPKWLCHTNTKQGEERRENCKATCTCHDRIK